MSVKTDARGYVNLKSANLKSLAVRGSETLRADVDGSIDKLDASGYAYVFLKAPSGIKNGSVDSACWLEANSTVLGTLAADGNFTEVFLPSCANVITSGGAKCTDGLSLYDGESFDISVRPATREGTYTCSVTSYNDSSSSGSTLVASLGVLLAIATASFMA